jgi:hypothetical protein
MQQYWLLAQTLWLRLNPPASRQVKSSFLFLFSYSTSFSWARLSLSYTPHRRTSRRNKRNSRGIQHGFRCNNSSFAELLSSYLSCFLRCSCPFNVSKQWRVHEDTRLRRQSGEKKEQSGAAGGVVNTVFFLFFSRGCPVPSWMPDSYTLNTATVPVREKRAGHRD